MMAGQQALDFLVSVLCDEAQDMKNRIHVAEVLIKTTAGASEPLLVRIDYGDAPPPAEGGDSLSNPA